VHVPVAVLHQTRVRLPVLTGQVLGLLRAVAAGQEPHPVAGDERDLLLHHGGRRAGSGAAIAAPSGPGRAAVLPLLTRNGARTDGTPRQVRTCRPGTPSGVHRGRPLDGRLEGRLPRRSGLSEVHSPCMFALDI
jgi:hypothetical protein